MQNSRRQFIKMSLFLPVLGFCKPLKARAETRGYHLNRFSVAGFQYYSGPRLIDHLKPDTALDLIAEPENQYDHYAVRIEWNGHKLGYVPRSDNRHISRLLRQEARLQAQVLENNPQAGPRQMLKMMIKMVI